jgi:hypothetical protein
MKGIFIVFTDSIRLYAQKNFLIWSESDKANEGRQTIDQSLLSWYYVRFVNLSEVWKTSKG